MNIRILIRREWITRHLVVLAVLAIALVGMAGAANYMYEKASVSGVGYKNVETIVSTQWGFSGAKLVEKESGSGNVITEKTELEADRELAKDGHPLLFDADKGIFLEFYKLYPTGIPNRIIVINTTNLTYHIGIEGSTFSQQKDLRSSQRKHPLRYR